MTRFRTLLLAPLFAGFSLYSSAADDSIQIRNAIETFLRQQTAGLPGQTSFSVSTVENNASRPACASLDVSMAPGARTLGKTTVLVRCRAEGGWAIYVPVQIRLISEYIVSNRPLGQGQLIREDDLSRQTGDLGNLPNGTLLDATQAVGKITAQSIPAGRPLVAEQLRQPPVVQAGQSVKVVSRGLSFEVSNDGRALASAAEGKVVQVRLSNGQIVSGIARANGVVEITF